MKAIKLKARVDQAGALRLPRLRLKKGTPVEVVLLVPEDEELTDLLQASAMTLDFWDNPSDEVWNDANTKVLAAATRTNRRG